MNEDDPAPPTCEFVEVWIRPLYLLASKVEPEEIHALMQMISGCVYYVQRERSKIKPGGGGIEIILDGCTQEHVVYFFSHYHENFGGSVADMYHKMGKLCLEDFSKRVDESEIFLHLL